MKPPDRIVWPAERWMKRISVEDRVDRKEEFFGI
jgi:hypothetical protein